MEVRVESVSRTAEGVEGVFSLGFVFDALNSSSGESPVLS